MEPHLLQSQLIVACNRWMDEYTNHPERFEAEFQTVGKCLSEKADGVEPSYGQRVTALLLHYASNPTATD